MTATADLDRPAPARRPPPSTSWWRSPTTTGTGTPSSRRSPRGPDGEVTLSAGTLYRSIQRMLEQGLILETARAARARARRRAAAVLPHHPARPSRGARGGAAAGSSWSSWRGRTASRRRGRDAALPRAAHCSIPSRSGPSTAARCAPSSSSGGAPPAGAAGPRDGLAERGRRASSSTRPPCTGISRGRTCASPPAPSPARRASRSPRSWSSRSASAPTPPRSPSPTSSCSGRCRIPDSDRLVKLWERVPGYSRLELSPANYRDWKAAAHRVREYGRLSPGRARTWWERASPTGSKPRPP